MILYLHTFDEVLLFSFKNSYTGSRWFGQLWNLYGDGTPTSSIFHLIISNWPYITLKINYTYINIEKLACIAIKKNKINQITIIRK